MPDLPACHPAHLRPGDERPRAVDDPSEVRRLDLARTVEDTLLLSTVDGAEDFLQSDLVALPGVHPLRRGRGTLTVRVGAPLDGLSRCRPYSAAAIPLPGALDDGPRLEPLADSVRDGVLRAVAPGRTLRFRVGVPDRELRGRVLAAVRTTLGWVADASGWDVNLTVERGSWVAQIGALHHSRRFGRLRRLPWSTPSVVAEVVVRMAKPEPGATVHDPCCGAATLLVVAAQQTGAARLSGTDHDPAALVLARHNLREHALTADLALAGAVPVPAPRHGVDRLVANLPFGKLVGSHAGNTVLYPALLDEVARTLAPDGRAVLLTEDKGLLRRAVQRTKGLKLVRERVLRYSGATPSVFVLTRTRRR